MAGRSGAYALRKDEIVSQLEESDIDLSEGDENDDTSYAPRPEEDKEPSSSSSSSSDEDVDSQTATIHSSENNDLCRRWSKKKKVYEFVSRPEIVKSYNQYMGGVDMADRLLSVCPSRSRTKKWTVRFISHMFDLAVSNAWLLYKQKETEAGVNKYKIPQLRSFKLNLGTRLIDQNTVSSDSESLDENEELQAKHKKRKVLITLLPAKSVRYHKAEHLIDYSDKQKRCRNPKCSNTTTAFCTKCNIFLCCTPKRNCHLTFHKK